MDAQTVMVSAVVGVATSAITAYITTRVKMSEERKKWERELALKYAEAAAVNPAVAGSLATQFPAGYLIVRQPFKQREKIFIPNHNRIIIGRSEGCAVFLHDKRVSRQAAAISSNGTSVFLEDLGSRKGILLNGVQLGHEPSKLESGDIITINETSLEFHAMG
jgi:pSer/pThr/pTyr-binding forkhead associated (FHA) protein